jgi:hypothetical protein
MAIKEKEREFCSGCVFAQRFGDGSHIKCRRFPPKDGFPTVNPDGWCGEFRKKQEN